MFTHPDLQRWLPSERLVAGNDSGGFVFDQRVVTKALRDIGPFAFMADGEPFAGCLFHEMVVADGRKMSKHLGNVVDPDELVAEHGADTVRIAILYAAGPAKALNWTDGAIRYASRFLRGIWDYTQDRIAAAAEAPDDPEAAEDTAFIRDRLGKWCDNGIEPDHRRLRGAADAQGGPRRRPAVRADPGLREADREAARAALEGGLTRPCSRRSRCSPARSPRSPRTSPRSC